MATTVMSHMQHLAVWSLKKYGMEKEADIFAALYSSLFQVAMGNPHKTDSRNFRIVITYWPVCYIDIIPCCIHAERV